MYIRIRVEAFKAKLPGIIPEIVYKYNGITDRFLTEATENYLKTSDQTIVVKCDDGVLSGLLDKDSKYRCHTDLYILLEDLYKQHLSNVNKDAMIKMFKSFIVEEPKNE